MIAKSVRFFANRTYTIVYRRFAKNPNPSQQARILAQIGVLQLAPFIKNRFKEGSSGFCREPKPGARANIDMFSRAKAQDRRQ